MPVLGHAFVGLTIGVATRPNMAMPSNASGGASASACWLPAMVGLAYLPDIVAQLGLMAGWWEGRLLGHSLVFAIAASPLIAAVLRRLASVSFARAWLTSVASLVLHDVLDLAQATDRAPWWPLSHRPVGVDTGLMPTGLVSETALFGGLLCAWVAVRRAAGRTSSRPADHARRTWWGPTFIVLVIVAALVTQWLREAREADAERARALVEAGAYRAGLEALAHADRWPSAAKPGRIEYLRAEAYAGLGDRGAAERSYRKAYRADPTYFWTVADLALFYASSAEPASERRRLVAPYMDRLRVDFAGHPTLPSVLAKLERRLQEGR
jgi:membrane-bound metal-dependent hydrolase YbcI (DUF457 family)